MPTPAAAALFCFRNLRMSNQAISELTQVSSLVEAIYCVDSYDELYQSILPILEELFATDRISVLTYHVTRQKLELVAMCESDSGSHSTKEAALTDIEKYHAEVRSPVICYPHEDGVVVAAGTDVEIVPEMHMASAIITPVCVRGEVVVTVELASRSQRYTAADVCRLTQLITIVDIAANRLQQAEKQVVLVQRHQLYAEHLQCLNTLGEKLSLVSSVDDALNRIADCAEKLVNAERVSYCELEPCGTKMRIMALVGKCDDAAGQVVPLELSGLADVLVENQQRYSTNLLESKSESQRTLAKSGLNHVWSFPVVCDGVTKGALNVAAKSIDLESSDATSVLATLSRFLGSTLQRVDAQNETLKVMGEVERQAKTDMLTGLPNRTEFHRRVRMELLRADPHEANVGILFLDLDHFKNINDTLGHDVGDELLCHVSRRLESLLEDSDTVARIGGDEFLILLHSIESHEMLNEFGTKLIRAVRQPLQIAGRALEVGVSVGAVSFPAHGESAEELIKHADIAMYHAKALGRNQCQVFNDALAASVSRRVRLEALLREAIANNELSLEFQPQFDYLTGRATAVEALLRWNHPVEGYVPPDEFICIAEQCGIVHLLTDWVLEHSLDAAKEFRKFEPELRVAVNVSASEFNSHSDLFDRVGRALERSGLPANALELELTETALLANPDHASALIRQFSAENIQLAIDDFGTGYASLSYLIQLPINTIKIDKSFVSGIESDVSKQSVVAGIITIATGMSLYCVGEGVETIEQFNWLGARGCHSAQGFFLSKPVSSDQIPNVLKLLTHYDKAA